MRFVNVERRQVSTLCGIVATCRKKTTPGFTKYCEKREDFWHAVQVGTTGISLALTKVIELDKLCSLGSQIQMHSKTLAAVSGWAAFNSANLIYGEEGQTIFAASNYWSAAKCRLDRWSRALRMFEKDVNQENSGHDPWPAIEVVVQEILVSEMLTRVWSAIMVCHDEEQQSDELSAIAYSTFLSQVEARNRALRLIVVSQTSDPEWFEKMNKLRRKVERWTDMLLGHLPNSKVAMEFGFEPNRVKDFSNERRSTSDAELRQKHPIFTAALFQDLQQSCGKFPANPSSNREIVSGVLSCFSADRFDSTGLPKSAQQLWVEKHSYDSQMLVDHLVELEFEVDSKVAASRF